MPYYQHAVDKHKDQIIDCASRKGIIEEAEVQSSAMFAVLMAERTAGIRYSLAAIYGDDCVSKDGSLVEIRRGPTDSNINLSK